MTQLLNGRRCPMKQKREGFNMEKRLSGKMVLLLLCGLVACGSLAYAQPAVQEKEAKKKTGYRHERQKGEERFLKDLNVMPEQKEKLKAHREAQKEKDRVLREQIQDKMQVLHAEFGKANVDRAQVNALVAEINNLKGQLFSQHTEGIFAMKEILTPEQFAKMQKNFTEHRGKHGRHGKHAAWGKGPANGPEEGPGGDPGEGPKEGPNE